MEQTTSSIAVGAGNASDAPSVYGTETEIEGVDRTSTSRLRALRRLERTEKWKERTRVARSLAWRRRRY